MSSAISMLMVHRAEVRRNASDKSSYGAKKNDTWTLVQDAVPCRVAVKSQRSLVDGKLVVLEVITALFRADADVEQGDRVEQVKDRRDRVVLDGPLIVDAVKPVIADAVVSHQSVALRRIRGT